MLSVRQINAHIRIGSLDLAAFAKEQGITLKRDIERAGSRRLLAEMLKTEDFTLCYTDLNKPYLQNRAEHMSISHSHDKLVIITNTKESTGIDIELIRDKVLKIQHKFLSASELGYAKDDVDKLLTIWAAKEAMFKAYGKKDLEFAQHIRVENFETSTLYGEIKIDDFHTRYNLASETIDAYRMVYILNEI
ncbi:MAG: 4'-phosphopantetheinyl transferase superfamily protein [bacterium]|nr:4'-phosphopantetheinyl transferase superfamily protein [bacterium]